MLSQRTVLLGPLSSTLLGLIGVSRARVTQIANLTLLAPDIQEAILFLDPVVKGRDPLTERDLRPLVAEPGWGRQRALWKALPAQRGRSVPATRRQQTARLGRLSTTRPN